MPGASRGDRVKAIRVRKTRRSCTCPICRRLVLVGDLIASVRGGPFMCLAHVTGEHTDGKEDTVTNTECKGCGTISPFWLKPVCRNAAPTTATTTATTRTPRRSRPQISPGYRPQAAGACTCA